MRKKRKIPGITVGGPLLPTPADFIRYTAEKKKRDRRRSSFFTTIIGGKGMGKTEQMEKQLDDKIDTVIAEEAISFKIDGAYFPETDVYAQASGGGGGSGQYTPQIQPPWTSQPASQQTGYWSTAPQPDWLHPSRTGDDTPPQQKPVSKKQEFTADDWRGKFCALCTITFKEGIEHKGILFVKKCGHWKLLEFNGSKIAGGTAGSFETELKKGRMKIEVHKTLYDADYVEPVIGADELEIL